MELMRVKLKDIRSNPFRDFDLYPIDEEQVIRLQQSIESLGFFTGVTARRVNGGFEMAAGHHRLEAAKRSGLEEVEAVVEAYTDTQMVQVMMLENLTQRGHNAASVLDSVASYSKVIAKEVLLGEGPVAKFLATAGPDKLSAAQTSISKDGPGIRLLYRAMNGFAKEERKANKDAENITSTEIDQALSTLKKGGVMGRIMVNVYAEVEVIRAERAEAERLEYEEQMRKAAKIEADRKAEEERQVAELKKRQEAEEKAKQQQEAAKEKDAKVRAEAAAEAEKRRQEREAAEKALAIQRKADAEAREAEGQARAKQKAEQRKREAAEHDRHAKERAAIKAQKELEAVYDPACAHIFRLSSHEKAFQEFVLSTNGKRFIHRDQQLPLAKQIRSEVDEVEKAKGIDLGSVTIRSMLDDHMSQIVNEQRKMDRDEKDRLGREISRRNIEEQWKTLRRGLVQAESALEKIVSAQRDWPYDTSFFPMHLDDIDRIIDVGRKMQQLKKALGY